jgi:phosphoribosyl 1,2-cyclic phosphodiesterase/ActR/RegA family two-component response regulator
MPKQLHFFILDDDEAILEQYSNLLKQAGHLVTISKSNPDALTKIVETHPDCVISDLLLPGMDVMELFQNIRNDYNIVQPKFIIITAKQFEYDKRRALEIGVDGYLLKPINPDTFLNELLEIINSKMEIQFFGCRGTLPVPGQKSVRYGGNTNCVTLRFSNKDFFIFDAGSGIKELSNYLLKEDKFPLSAKIFISHPHYDHINGIPFFVPLYMQGNEVEILGANDGDITVDKLISNQMDSVYFPITTKEFAAKITYRNLGEEEFDIDELRIKTILLNHPGKCLGYSVQYQNKLFCYITDLELIHKDEPHYEQVEVDRLIQFISEANVLIIDSTYTEEEYQKKTGWGHSSIDRVIDIADKAKVKLVCLYHHDPDQTDDDIDNKLKQARLLLQERKSRTVCIAPREGDILSI